MTKEFVTLKLSDIKPYPNNPRRNDDAVKYVVKSIEECENLDPIEIDENNVILSGHTRLKALQQLGYAETECIRYDGLTEEQKKKYRLLANKTGEFAEWDIDLLQDELADIDFDGFDFEFLDDEESENKKNIKGECEFSEILGEENNYVVLQFKTDVDWLQAQSLLGIETVKAYSTRKDGKLTKSMTRTGVARVLDGAEVLNRLVGEIK